MEKRMNLYSDKTRSKINKCIDELGKFYRNYSCLSLLSFLRDAEDITKAVDYSETFTMIGLIGIVYDFMAEYNVIDLEKMTQEEINNIYFKLINDYGFVNKRGYNPKDFLIMFRNRLAHFNAEFWGNSSLITDFEDFNNNMANNVGTYSWKIDTREMSATLNLNELNSILRLYYNSIENPSRMKSDIFIDLPSQDISRINNKSVLKQFLEGVQVFEISSVPFGKNKEDTMYELYNLFNNKNQKMIVEKMSRGETLSLRELLEYNAEYSGLSSFLDRISKGSRYDGYNIERRKYTENEIESFVKYFSAVGFRSFHESHNIDNFTKTLLTLQQNKNNESNNKEISTFYNMMNTYFSLIKHNITKNPLILKEMQEDIEFLSFTAPIQYAKVKTLKMFYNITYLNETRRQQTHDVDFSSIDISGLWYDPKITTMNNKKSKQENLLNHIRNSMVHSNFRFDYEEYYKSKDFDDIQIYFKDVDKDNTETFRGRISVGDMERMIDTIRVIELAREQE